MYYFKSNTFSMFFKLAKAKTDIKKQAICTEFTEKYVGTDNS